MQNNNNNNNNDNDNEYTAGGLSKQHLLGASIISIAVLLGILPSVIKIIHPTNIFQTSMSMEKAWNTIVFTLTCIPAAASTLYKEYTLTHYQQPVDPHVLNFLLSLFQFIIAVLISPLLFPLQGLGYSPKYNNHNNNSYSSWWQVYPSNQVSMNFMHGIQCFESLGTPLDDNIQSTGYAEVAQCDLAWLWVLLNVLAIILVGLAADKIIHAGATKIMYRGMSAGVILAVGSMYWYEIIENSNNTVVREEGVFFMNWFYLICMVILMIGSEVYHRVSLPNATFETIYPEVEHLYEE